MSEPKPHLNSRVQDACAAAFLAWLMQNQPSPADVTILLGVWTAAWDQALQWEAVEYGPG